jgi:hypothetical protein
MPNSAQDYYQLLSEAQNRTVDTLLTKFPGYTLHNQDGEQLTSLLLAEAEHEIYFLLVTDNFRKNEDQVHQTLVKLIEANEYQAVVYFLEHGGAFNDALNKKSLLRSLASKPTHQRMVRYLVKHIDITPAFKEGFLDSLMNFIYAWLSLAAFFLSLQIVFNLLATIFFLVMVSYGKFCALLENFIMCVALSFISPRITYTLREAIAALPIHWVIFFELIAIIPFLIINIFSGYGLYYIFLAQVMESVIVSLIFTVICTKRILYNSFIRAPGFLGEQQKRLRDWVSTKQFHQMDVYIDKNYHWLFIPLNLSNNNTLELMAQSKEGRDALIIWISKIAKNPSTLKYLLSDKYNSVLKAYPHLLEFLLNDLSVEQFAENKEALCTLFSSQLPYFANNAKNCAEIFAKLTVAWYPGGFLLHQFINRQKDPNALEFISHTLQNSPSSPLIELSKGLMAISGLYGTAPPNTQKSRAFNQEAIDAFKKVPYYSNLYLYALAREQLFSHYLGTLNNEITDDKATNTKWAQYFFQGHSYIYNLVELETSDLKIQNIKKNAARLSCLDDLSVQVERYFSEEFLNWKTEEGYTPTVLAAKLGAWVLVEKILTHYPESDTLRAQYQEILISALRDKQGESIIPLLLEKGALKEKLFTDISGDTVWHHAVRINNYGFFGSAEQPETVPQTDAASLLPVLNQ